MRQFVAVVMLLLIVGLGVGCEVVYSLEPVGLKPATLNPKDWDGAWLCPEGTVRIKVVDPEGGLLQLGWIEPQGGRLVAKFITVRVRQSRSSMYVNLTRQDLSRAIDTGKMLAEPLPDEGATVDPKSQWYVWGRIQKDPGQIIVWIPDASAIKPLVESGQLPGRVTENELVMGPLDEVHDRRLADDQQGMLFEWERPLVFERWRP